MKKYLILDIGNSMIDAYYWGKNSEFFFSIDVKNNCSLALETYLLNVDKQYCEDLIIYISSVNRPVEKLIKEKYGKLAVPTYSLNCELMNNYIRKNNFTISNTEILGADLFADIIGGNNDAIHSELIADFGTATKLLLVNKDQKYIGGTIFPGIYSCANILNEKTDLLEFVNMKTPENMISLKTDEAINAGAIYGTAFMIQGYYQFFRSQSDYRDLQISITGGGGDLVAGALEKIGFNAYTYDRFRIIRGIIKAFELQETVTGGLVYAAK